MRTLIIELSLQESEQIALRLHNTKSQLQVRKALVLIQKISNSEARDIFIFIVLETIAHGYAKASDKIKSQRSEISGSHGGEYEDGCLLGCYAV
jgi:hypothetical protein